MGRGMFDVGVKPWGEPTRPRSRSTSRHGRDTVGRNENQVSDVSGFAPPGDIHRVRNTSETTAISIHVCGTDVTRIGSSARRYYD
jgi:predicted metal-dependent enzyme (double-stranded beta helix superfamily)